MVQIHPDPPILSSLNFQKHLCAGAHRALLEIQSEQNSDVKVGIFDEEIKSSLAAFSTLSEEFGEADFFSSARRAIEEGVNVPQYVT